MNYDILVSPIQYSRKTGYVGEFFEVLRSDGGVGMPNGVHDGCSCKGARDSYIDAGIQVAEDMDEFNLLKDWYMKIMPNIIFTVANGIESNVKELMKNLVSSFPKEG